MPPQFAGFQDATGQALASHALSDHRIERRSVVTVRYLLPALDPGSVGRPAHTARTGQDAFGARHSGVSVWSWHERHPGREPDLRPRHERDRLRLSPIG